MRTPSGEREAKTARGSMVPGILGMGMRDRAHASVAARDPAEAARLCPS